MRYISAMYYHYNKIPINCVGLWILLHLVAAFDFLVLYSSCISGFPLFVLLIDVDPVLFPELRSGLKQRSPEFFMSFFFRGLWTLIVSSLTGLYTPLMFSDILFIVRSKSSFRCFSYMGFQIVCVRLVFNEENEESHFIFFDLFPFLLHLIGKKTVLGSPCL